MMMMMMMMKVVVITVCRFELWVRESCPRPFSEANDLPVLRCDPGPLQPVLKSLVYSAYVDDLTPYTKYEFQLSVDNDAGSLQQAVSTYATTLPDGISIIDSVQFGLVTELLLRNYDGCADA